VPSIIVVANTENEDRVASREDRRSFQLRERVSATDLDNPHFSSQLIERIAWALADAEEAERAGAPPETHSRSDGGLQRRRRLIARFDAH
jgi:hypothetical protein